MPADHAAPPEPGVPRRVVPVLAGPTASGKTAAVLRLAGGPGGRGLEVVSADAMQVYRGLDVASAKPTAAERARVPHHALDLVEPAEPFSVAAWVAAAEAAIEDVWARGGRPLVVGGTGFYLSALQEGLPTTPPSDPALRAALEAELAERGLDALETELRAAAPADAARAQRNPRRVVRALEVLRATGRPPSAYPTKAPRFAVRTFVALPPPARLVARVHERVAGMIAAGLVDEVARLLATVPPGATVWQAIGPKEIAPALRGERPLADALADLAAATLRYAKRQRTWFAKRPAGAERHADVLDALDGPLAAWWRRGDGDVAAGGG
jgi:tRNA dimethylallyltransferase